MSQIKYVLHPDFIYDRATGIRTFVNNLELCALYGVPAEECWLHQGGSEDPAGCIHLHPRADGNYTLPRPDHTPTIEGVTEPPNSKDLLTAINLCLQDMRELGKKAEARQQQLAQLLQSGFAAARPPTDVTGQPPETPPSFRPITLTEAVELLAKELPEFWEIRIHIENGAAWLSAETRQGEPVQLNANDSDGTLAERLLLALEELTGFSYDHLKPKGTAP